MFDGDQKPLQAQLKMNSLSPAVDCGKIAVDHQPEGGAFCHKYKHSNFISSSEYIVAVLWMNAIDHNVCGRHSKQSYTSFFFLWIILDGFDGLIRFEK